MKRFRYAFSLAFAIISLTVVAMVAFSRISSATQDAATAATVSAPVVSPLPVEPMLDSAAVVSRLAAEDEAWRKRHVRNVTLAEIRQRGDGLRTPRQALDDRVYLYVRNGDRGRAIAELERWVTANPRDEDALLSLARLLKESGRTDDAAARYRQLLALQEK